MRRTPMPRPRRSAPSPAEQDARDVVLARSQGACETRCGRPGTDWSHRVSRAQGGLWSPSNGLLLCRWCHSWCHRHPEHAVSAGLMLRGSADPSCDPVWLPLRRAGQVVWRWCLLEEDGGIDPDATWAAAPPPQYPPDMNSSPRWWLLDPALTEETR